MGIGLIGAGVGASIAGVQAWMSGYDTETAIKAAAIGGAAGLTAGLTLGASWAIVSVGAASGAGPNYLTQGVTQGNWANPDLISIAVSGISGAARGGIGERLLKSQFLTGLPGKWAECAGAFAGGLGGGAVDVALQGALNWIRQPRIGYLNAAYSTPLTVAPPVGRK